MIAQKSSKRYYKKMEGKQTLGRALSRVRKIADQNGVEVIRSAQISRTDRELLIRFHWLQEIIKGWYLLTRPDIASGDSSHWYASFWDFLGIYLNHRFGKRYCLSAESSLDIYTESPLIPRQIVVMVAKSGGACQELPYRTSLLTYVDPKNIPHEKVIIRNLQLMPLSYALCKASPTYFQKNAEDAEIALRLIKSPAELSRVLLLHDFKRAGSRLVGAYRFLKEKKIADSIEADLAAAGWMLSIENPFEHSAPLLSRERLYSPYAARIEALWQMGRQSIIDCFPSPKRLPKNAKIYLDNIAKIYEYDAYNSLSIEGYRVSPELIRKVQENQWNPDLDLEDQSQRNALAAKGYFEAHLAVLKTIRKILKGTSAGKVVKNDLQKWYQSLFSSSIKAGILKPSQLIGYRTHKVYIRNSRHVPPSHEAVADAMDALFSCLIKEPHAGVRAVLGHYIFVFIHPYMDGNGRIARFLMNAMLASGGYPWTIIQMKHRIRYMKALDAADTERDFQPFARFIAEEMVSTRERLEFDYPATQTR